ncbi:hypothetical protein CBI38_33915 (plasmid) [Rhodococcus oxybenzonivorans]|uniref:Uncharacterized protein n=1 Tax=Rhodococcus oxybenzonivorans TaxID=1990687 RepID=A0A2S2C6A6_9NOCA|nr:hypothetical protein [Rhodococcus oxybenzonivorans]AWK76406.1 hypothetical protein CBI38_33915 [Rhodococcus oxybenzonivorans]
MPSKLRVLNDLTTSGPIDSTQFQRIAVLDLDAGHPLLVTATGTVEGVDLQFNSRVTIRLELRDGSVAAARPESQTSFQAPASPVFAALETFSLIAASDALTPIPSGTAVLRPPRAVLSARKEGSSGAFAFRNIRIVALTVDEIVETTIGP